jgi:hypothetical protein
MGGNLVCYLADNMIWLHFNRSTYPSYLINLWNSFIFVVLFFVYCDLISILINLAIFFQVPKSSKKLYEDNEYALYTVTLFGRVADNFRTAARERGFQVSML